jgi:aminoglycoside phosphotransferase (APT) family kinase protein
MADDPMTPAELPGPLIASGRDADVFDIGDGRVLRRKRTPSDAVIYETRVMRFMHEQHRAGRGVRLPEVFDLDGDHDPTRDIVMEHVDGDTMIADLEQRPWKVIAYGNLLARLQRQINDVIAPDWMTTPSTAAAAQRRDDSVLHLDLHPPNVIMSPSGPVVIDWTNAAGGPAGFDAALSYVEMATFEVAGLRDRIGQRLMVGSFKRARGSGEIDAFTVAACDHRLADANLTPGERVAVGALRKQAVARGGGQ